MSVTLSDLAGARRRTAAAFELLVERGKAMRDLLAGADAMDLPMLAAVQGACIAAAANLEEGNIARRAERIRRTGRATP